MNTDKDTIQAENEQSYMLPPLSLLLPPEKETEGRGECAVGKETIRKVFAFFGVDVEVTDVKAGPVFTTYLCRADMPQGIAPETLLNYEKDLGQQLEEPGARIVLSDGGEGVFAVEVPCKQRRTVHIGELLLSQSYRDASSPTMCALGEDSCGRVVAADVKDFPHMFVAGMYGSGKSMFLHSLIMSMIFRASPDEVRFIMIAPKLSKFIKYNSLPHLMTETVITSPAKAVAALEWAVDEMMNRLLRLAQHRCRDIGEYNLDRAQTGAEKMPRIVVVIDEFVELMVANKKKAEEALFRLVRMARSVGIHVVMAMQGIFTDIIGKEVINCFQSRVACALSTAAESRIVTGGAEAENLLGDGDMLYVAAESARSVRLQGALVTDREIEDVVKFVKEHGKARPDRSLQDALSKGAEIRPAETPERAEAKDDGSLPPVFFEALRKGLDGSPVTISGMQRKLGLGFPLAAKMFDIMVDMHLIATSGTDQKHRVCVTAEQIDELESENRKKEEDAGGTE